MRAEQEREYVEYVRARVLPLRRTAFRLCGDWHRAEDLVQKALVLLYRHWKRAAAAESIDAYARRVLVNVFLEDQRGAWARRIAPVAVPVDDVVADASAAADHRLDLTSALARIAPGQRAVLVLRYWERLDVAETAAALGCSPGTVKSQTSLAIAALRRLLPGYATDREPSAPGEGASR